MGRHDYTIEQVRKSVKLDSCDQVVLIVDEYPEIDYVLAYRGGEISPWVAAWHYNGKNSWGQGHYFDKLENAIAYIEDLKREV